LGSFAKPINETQVSLKSDKNNGYLIWRPIYVYYLYSFSSSSNEKCYRRKLWRKSKHTFYAQQFFFSPSKSGVLWDNVEKYSRPVLAQMRVWRMSIACGTTKAADIHSEYLLPFQCNNGCTKASQY